MFKLRTQSKKNQEILKTFYQFLKTRENHWLKNTQTLNRKRTKVFQFNQKIPKISLFK